MGKLVLHPSRCLGNTLSKMSWDFPLIYSHKKGPQLQSLELSAWQRVLGSVVIVQNGRRHWRQVYAARVIRKGVIRKENNSLWVDLSAHGLSYSLLRSCRRKGITWCGIHNIL